MEPQAVWLVHQLMEARNERRLLKLQAQLDAVTLLIVDESPGRGSTYQTEEAVQTSGERWLGEFEQGDKWSICLTAARKAADREKVDDETSAPEPRPAFKAKVALAALKGEKNVGRVGAAIRRSRQSDHAMEGAASGRDCRDIRVLSQGRSRRTGGGFEVAELTQNMNLVE